MSTSATRPRPDFSPEPSLRGLGTPQSAAGGAESKLIGYLGLLWGERREAGRWMLGGLLLATLLAFVLPKQYQSSAQLMPPESQSGSAGMLAALSAKAGGNIGSMAGG